MADFLGKITGGIDKGIKTISSKSKEFIEITRLKGELRDVDATLQIKFNAVGKKVFQMMNRGALNKDDIKTECSEIAACYKRVTEIEENIKKAEKEALKAQYGVDAVMCRACGGVNKATDQVCNICSSAIADEEKKDCRPCPSCNALVSQESKFCASCGKAMPDDSEITVAVASAKLCSNCNQQIGIEEIFCHSCGTKQLPR